MRMTLVIGSLALSLALGAGAAYADNPNVAGWSPYALMAFGAPQPSAPAIGRPLYETRAAVVEGAGNALVVAGANSNVPGWSPYAIMPQAQ